jgi:hypothetical protein
MKNKKNLQKRSTPLNPFTFYLLPFTFLPFFLLIFSFFLFWGCSKNGTDGNDNTVTVSGKVTLEEQSDHSGVKVSLYKPVELDPELVAVNQQYPNIGIKISQETEFDHREQTPVYSTATNAAGEWNFEKVTPGTYHVVAEKDDFGWRYDLNEEFNGDRTIDLGQLKPVQYLRGNLSQDIITSEDFFIVDNNFVVPQGKKLELTNCVILVYPGISITITGQAKLMGIDQQFTRLLPYLLNQYWRGVVVNFNSGETEFENVVFKNANRAVRLFTAPLKIQSLYIKNSNQQALSAQSLPNLSVKNLLAVASNDVLINMEFTNNYNLQNCIFLKSTKEAILTRESAGKITNSLFRLNDTGYQGVMSIDTLINCEFNSNKANLIINTSTYAHISKTNLLDTEGWNISQFRNIAPHIWGRGKINNNNINGNSLLRGYQEQDSAYFLHVENNWWGTNEINTIMSRMNANLYLLPIANSPIPDAGINK